MPSRSTNYCAGEGVSSGFACFAALQVLAVLMLLDGYIGFDCFHGSDGFDTSVRFDNFSPFVVFDVR